MLRCILALAGLARAAAPLGAAAQTRPEGGWVGAWEASPQAQPPPPPGPLKPLKNQTVRQRARLAIGGRQVRVVLSNAYGTKPLVIDAASVARTLTGGAVDPAGIVPLTFGGSSAITIPAGAPALSDPVTLPVEAGAELAVSLHLPSETVPETYHRGQPAQDAAGAAPSAPVATVSGEGDFTRAAAMPGTTLGQRLFVSRIDVAAPQAAGAVVVLGTTRTDGDGHWPELLAARLQASGRRLSVINASMVANPLTRPYPGGGEAGLARFDRDVLDVPRVSHVVIADAINDIGQPGGNVTPASDMPTLDQLKGAYRQLAARAHARGIRVIAATLLPFEGVPFAGFYSADKEALRAGLNAWVRTSKDFDGVIDLDAIMRDPAHPATYLPGLSTANHFAPNDAGEAKIAAAVDLKLFR